jgi:hypothetical protein
MLESLLGLVFAERIAASIVTLGRTEKSLKVLIMLSSTASRSS